MEQLPKQLNLETPESNFDKVLTTELMRYTMKIFNLVGKGTVPPRMTEAERDLITSPQQGLIIVNTDTSKLNFYTGAGWEEITSA